MHPAADDPVRDRGVPDRRRPARRADAAAARRLPRDRHARVRRDHPDRSPSTTPGTSPAVRTGSDDPAPGDPPRAPSGSPGGRTTCRTGTCCSVIAHHRDRAVLPARRVPSRPRLGGDPRGRGRGAGVRRQHHAGQAARVRDRCLDVRHWPACSSPARSATSTRSLFTLQASILVVAYVVFGGMGSLAGAMAGAAVLTWLPQFLKDQVPAGRPADVGRRASCCHDDLPAGRSAARARRKAELRRPRLGAVVGSRRAVPASEGL